MGFIVTREKDLAEENEFNRRDVGEGVISFFSSIIAYQKVTGCPQNEMESNDFLAVCALLNELLDMKSRPSYALSLPGWSTTTKAAFEDLALLTEAFIRDFEIETVFSRVYDRWFAPVKLHLADRKEKTPSLGEMEFNYRSWVTFQLVESDDDSEIRIQAKLLSSAEDHDALIITLFDELVMFDRIDEQSFFRCADAVHAIWADLLVTSNVRREPRGEKPDSIADPKVPLKWSTPDSPSRWAKRFKLSIDTLKRMFDAGTIRVKKLSTKSWQIAVDDLPANDQNCPTEG